MTLFDKIWMESIIEYELNNFYSDAMSQWRWLDDKR